MVKQWKIRRKATQFIDIKRLVKANKLFKKTYEESEYYFKNFFKKPVADYQRLFLVRYKEPISELEESIKNNKEYVYVLWETLSSDDFIGMLEKYHEYWIFTEALKSEWEAYLEEISNIEFQPSLLKYLKNKEILNEPISLNLRPKNNNLAIK